MLWLLYTVISKECSTITAVYTLYAMNHYQRNRQHDKITRSSTR